jgi:hypothetical protein
LKRFFNELLENKIKSMYWGEARALSSLGLKNILGKNVK